MWRRKARQGTAQEQEPPTQSAAASPAGGFLTTMKTPRPARGAAASRKEPTARQGAAGLLGAPADHAAESIQNAGDRQREPVLLILDSSLQALPWESAPGLRGQRCASTSYEARYLVSGTARRHNIIVITGMTPGVLSDDQHASTQPRTSARRAHASCRMFRTMSLACVGAALERRCHIGIDPSQEGRRPADAPVPPCIDAGDAYYLLNPDGDLAPTQAAFERWFASLRGWQARLLPVLLEAPTLALGAVLHVTATRAVSCCPSTRLLCC